jgi:hypothetical protein
MIIELTIKLGFEETVVEIRGYAPMVEAIKEAVKKAAIAYNTDSVVE